MKIVVQHKSAFDRSDKSPALAMTAEIDADVVLVWACHLHRCSIGGGHESDGMIVSMCLP